MKILYLIIGLLLISTVSARIEDTIKQSVPVYYCDSSYELEAEYISVDRVRFSLNGEYSELVGYHDTIEFEDGSRLYVRDILEEDSAEGVDMVDIRFYPEFCRMGESAEDPKELVEVAVEESMETSEVDEPSLDIVEPPIVEEIPEPPIVEEVSVDEAVIAEQPVENISLFRRIINWFKSLFNDSVTN